MFFFKRFKGPNRKDPLNIFMLIFCCRFALISFRYDVADLLRNCYDKSWLFCCGKFILNAFLLRINLIIARTFDLLATELLRTISQRNLPLNPCYGRISRYSLAHL